MPDRPSQPRPAGTALEAAQFQLGIASAFDDSSAQAPGDAGIGETVTTLISWWNHLTCDSCGHTFRRGDRVWRDTQSWTVRHLDRSLGCLRADAGPAEPVQDSEPPGAIGSTLTELEELAEFARGLDEVWPLAVGTEVTTLSADDWRVRRPPAPLGRARCLYCAHTFRAGERVVVCPCRPDDPACGAAVHRQSAVGLVCWESWNSRRAAATCPITSVPLEPDGPA